MEELTAERWLVAVVASSNDAIIGKGLDGNVRFWNAAAERLFGYPAAEAMGRPFHDTVGTQQVDELPEIFARAFRGETIEHVEMVRIRKDGALIHVSINLSPVRDGLGALIGIAFIARDIASEKRLASALRHADRLATLGTVVAALVHEINGPLTYLLGNLTALERRAKAGGRDEEEVRLVHDAHEGAMRIRTLAADVRTFARSDAARTSAHDAHALIDTALRLVLAELSDGIVVRKDYGPPLIVDVDGPRLVQVFTNLLLNAAHAVQAIRSLRQPEIVVSTRIGPDRKGIVRIADNGPGISATDLAHVFEPFFTTKAEGVGTGLGLAICRDIVTGLGGDIAVETEIGSGTAFVVRLTLSEG